MKARHATMEGSYCLLGFPVSRHVHRFLSQHMLVPLSLNHKTCRQSSFNHQSTILIQDSKCSSRMKYPAVASFVTSTGCSSDTPISSRQPWQTIFKLGSLTALNPTPSPASHLSPTGLHCMLLAWCVPRTWLPSLSSPSQTRASQHSCSTS